jgi:hypothetical protein
MKKFVMQLKHELYAESLEEALATQCDEWQLDFVDGFRFPEGMEVFEEDIDENDHGLI